MQALAKRVVLAGVVRIIGVGGDGTHHDILNGIVAAEGLGRVTYAPLPLGTGNDWVRTLQTPHQPQAWLKALLTERTIAHTVGQIHQGAKTTCFLNVAGMAYDAEVVRRSETARFKHRLLYPLLTLLYLRGFTPPSLRVTYDGNTFTGPSHTVNVGIGRYSGGGMRLVPQADPTASTLALTIAERLPVWRILLESWRFYTGTIDRILGVTTTTAKAITVETLAGACHLEADGELLGGLPATFTLLDGRLRVVTG